MARGAADLVPLKKELAVLARAVLQGGVGCPASSPGFFPLVLMGLVAAYIMAAGLTKRRI